MIRIESDGYTFGTTITDTETGAELKNITKAVITIDANEVVARVSFEVPMVELDILAEKSDG